MQTNAITQAFARGEGIFRMVPNFVPRNFSRPGRRLRLHPDDYFALGMQRGAIKERWFSSVTPANNGPLAPADEGLSYIAPTGDVRDKVLFRDAVQVLGAGLIGQDLMEAYGTWPMYAKFFDYSVPLFHHLHLDDEKAALIGRLGKPEAYYFPPQYNPHLGEFPVTYFGFDPDTDPEAVKQCLRDFAKGDNRITELSRAYRIQLGTGWYTPAGVVHAPGSVLTYEPQWNSDVNAVFENLTAEEVNPLHTLNENCPPNRREDIEFLFSLMDWQENIDPHYRKKYFRPPVPCQAPEGAVEKWISYANPFVGAKELTVLPGQTVRIADPVAYGCIVVQGHGKFGVYACEAAQMLRYGQLSGDEYFVSRQAAEKGVVIHNQSAFEPLVILKHFAPNHPGMPQAVQ